MYEYISGQVAELAPTYVVVDVVGVGYLINISLETYSAIEHAEHAKLFIHYIVREDAQILYGFATKQERELFRLLISVSGVGGNTARMVLSTYSPREIQSIISTENAVLLKSVKGLGLKTAQKIIVELTGKVGALGDDGESALPQVVSLNSEVALEALEALTMLGFPKAASDKSIKAILKESPDVSVENLIRLALKRL
ncbi:MAG: Holliday junction branch migration protein RuvA [Rikenellaceae bacterium]